jgi:hypothetical protein
MKHQMKKQQILTPKTWFKMKKVLDELDDYCDKWIDDAIKNGKNTEIAGETIWQNTMFKNKIIKIRRRLKI